MRYSIKEIISQSAAVADAVRITHRGAKPLLMTRSERSGPDEQVLLQICEVLCM